MGPDPITSGLNPITKPGASSASHQKLIRIPDYGFSRNNYYSFVLQLITARF